MVPEIPIYKKPFKDNNSIILFAPRDLIAEDEVFVFITHREVPNILPYRYMISNYGRVWDTTREVIIAQTFDCKGFNKGPNGEQIPRGYLYFKVIYYKNAFEYDFKRVRTNRIVLMAFNYIPGCEELEAGHKDGVHWNNKLTNLEWQTREENLEHAYVNRLYRSGEKSPSTYISDETAHKICQTIINYPNLTFIEIGKMFNVSGELVGNIHRCHSFRHIAYQYGFPIRKHRK